MMIEIRMKNKEVFQLIDRKKLHGEILSKLDVLMAIDQQVCISK